MCDISRQDDHSSSPSDLSIIRSVKRREGREARCLQGENYSGYKLLHQVLQTFHMQFVFLEFPWCFLNVGDNQLQTSLCLSKWCQRYYWAHSAPAELWKPAFSLEPCHRYAGQTGGSLRPLVSPPTRNQGWPWCLLFSTSGSIAEECSTKLMLLLTQETFSFTIFTTKDNTVIFSKIIGSHYSRYLL